MSEVTLQVGGRPYTVACADGEEARVRDLAAIVDEKLAGLGGNLAREEAKNLLFAALILADEVDELRRRGGGAPASHGPSPGEAEAARTLESLAARLERLAQVVEKAAPGA